MRRMRLSITSSLGLCVAAILSTSAPAQETPTQEMPAQQAPDQAPGQEAPAPENAPAAASGTESGGATGIAAKPAEDSWPCEQRLQPELSIGAMWSGPDPTAATDSWRQDTAVQTLVSQVGPRRLPQDEAIAAIHRFAVGYNKDKANVMTEVFAGLFETLNQERGQIIRGIRHFNDRQKKLADRIQVSTKALDNLDPNSNDQAVAEQRAALQQVVAWDSRIFDDRERLLPIICGVPVTIERRLFVLSRAIGDEIAPKN